MTNATPKNPDAPVPSIEIENPIDLNVDLSAAHTEILNWLQNSILTWDSAAQGVILMLGFTFAVILGKPLKAKMTERINNIAKIPFRLTQSLHSLTRLVFPAIALVTIFLGTKIVGPGGLDFNVGFCLVVTKLLSAWIVIRIIVQFIDNRFARNIFAMAIWAIAAPSWVRRE